MSIRKLVDGSLDALDIQLVITREINSKLRISVPMAMPEIVKIRPTTPMEAVDV
jgi:hypothetical protein